MSYILVKAVNRNLKRTNDRYSNIIYDINAEYNWANQYFFKQGTIGKTKSKK